MARKKNNKKKVKHRNKPHLRKPRITIIRAKNDILNNYVKKVTMGFMRESKLGKDIDNIIIDYLDSKCFYCDEHASKRVFKFNKLWKRNSMCKCYGNCDSKQFRQHSFM